MNIVKNYNSIIIRNINYLLFEQHFRDFRFVLIFFFLSTDFVA
jgi:hypothetical protein